MGYALQYLRIIYWQMPAFMLVVNVPISFALCCFTTLPVVAVITIVLSADFIKCVIGGVLIHKNVWLNNLVEA